MSYGVILRENATGEELLNMRYPKKSLASQILRNIALEWVYEKKKKYSTEEFLKELERGSLDQNPYELKGKSIAIITEPGENRGRVGLYLDDKGYYTLELKETKGLSKAEELKYWRVEGNKIIITL